MGLLPAQVAQTMHFAVSPRAMAFAAVLTIGTGLLFGLFPALHSTRPDLVSTLKSQAGQPSGARKAARFRLALATTQIARSMLLLAASGFFVKSLLNVSRVDLGIKTDNMITFRVSPALNGSTPERSRVFFQQLEEQIAATPGVTATTVSTTPILSGSNNGHDVAVQGFEAGPDTDSNSRVNQVGPGYFAAMGVPLIGGREFAAADILTADKVAIVNEAFVKKFNLGQDAVGKMMGAGRGYRSPLDTRIVGVVRNAKYSEVKRQIPPVFFRPYADRLGRAADDRGPRGRPRPGPPRVAGRSDDRAETRVNPSSLIAYPESLIVNPESLIVNPEPMIRALRAGGVGR